MEMWKKKFGRPWFSAVSLAESLRFCPANGLDPSDQSIKYLSSAHKDAQHLQLDDLRSPLINLLRIHTVN